MLLGYCGFLWERESRYWFAFGMDGHRRGPSGLTDGFYTVAGRAAVSPVDGYPLEQKEVGFFHAAAHELGAVAVQGVPPPGPVGLVCCGAHAGYSCCLVCFIGVLVHWCTGLPVDWCTGVPVFLFIPFHGTGAGAWPGAASLMCVAFLACGCHPGLRSFGIVFGLGIVSSVVSGLFVGFRGALESPDSVSASLSLRVSRRLPYSPSLL